MKPETIAKLKEIVIALDVIIGEEEIKTETPVEATEPTPEVPAEAQAEVPTEVPAEAPVETAVEKPVEPVEVAPAPVDQIG